MITSHPDLHTLQNYDYNSRFMLWRKSETISEAWYLWILGWAHGN